MTLEHLPLFAGPAAIVALCAVPIRWPDVLSGWRFGVWCTVGVILIGLMLRHLMPDLDSARAPIATITVGLGISATGLLSVAIAERWKLRHTIPLAVTSAVCGLLHLLAPAYADEGAAVAVVPAASPLVPPELVGLPVPSWLTTLLAGAALARYLTTMLAKGVKVTVELVHTLPPGAPHLEIHHNHPAPVQPAPDPTDEHSGVRRAPRGAR